VKWVDWWLVLLGVSFVLVTLFAPKGIGGLFDLIPTKKGAEE
jgi:urea transport system permease protein